MSQKPKQSVNIRRADTLERAQKGRERLEIILVPPPWNPIGKAHDQLIHPYFHQILHNELTLTYVQPIRFLVSNYFWKIYFQWIFQKYILRKYFVESNKQLDFSKSAFYIIQDKNIFIFTIFENNNQMLIQCGLIRYCGHY